jgi:hypothetical protein
MQVVYDMAGTFTSGQAYVALSRATSLQGLYLKNFKESLIYRSESVHQSLQEMTSFLIDTPKSTGNYHVVHHNVQGLRSKLADIKSNKDMSNVTVLAVTESWLQTRISDEQISLQGYTVCRKDRSDGRGGVAVYVSQDAAGSILDIPSSLEHCTVEITPPEHAPFVVVTIYRSPLVPLQWFIPRLRELLYTVSEHVPSNIVVTGDFNENQLDKNAHPIHDCFTDYGFRQLVQGRTTSYGSLLDLVFVRTKDYLCSHDVVQTYYSDHEAVKLSLAIK